MAVTQESDGNSKKSVEEPAQHCSTEGADRGPLPRGLIREKKSDGPPTRHNGMRKDNGVTVRIGKQGRINIIKNRADGLSVIDDIEVVGYLNTKEEMCQKRIFWEAMNENYVKVKKHKQAAETKKVASAKKATKTSDKVEPKKRSSRINYDALESMGGDMHKESCESAQTSVEASYAQHDISYDDETHYQYEDEDFYDDTEF